MTENGGPDRPRGEANEVSSKSEKRSGQQILIGKVELAEDKTGRSAVEKKVVPPIAVPTVDAITALRSCALCSAAGNGA
jgi:hypothetical protein